MMEDANMSDESDFFGNEHTVRKWEKRSKEVDVAAYWENRARDLNVIHAAKVEQNHPSIPKGGFHNRYDGLESAWQAHETIDDFIKRLPVHGSSWVGPWLWVANPYSDRDAEPELSHARFMQLAPRLLEDYLDHKRQVTEENPNRVPGVITRKLLPARTKLKEDILALAKEHQMLSGKWMLFPNEDDAPGVWKRVAAAVIAGKLGTAAKIATDADGKDARLICIYTKDFSDEEDVKRVVKQIKNLGLLPRDESRSIYYKCDAYTFLGLGYQNEYGLQASLYASKDVLDGKTTAVGGSKNQIAGNKRASNVLVGSNAAGKRKKV